MIMSFVVLQLQWSKNLLVSCSLLMILLLLPCFIFSIVVFLYQLTNPLITLVAFNTRKIEIYYFH